MNSKKGRKHFDRSIENIRRKGRTKVIYEISIPLSENRRSHLLL